MPGHRGLGEQCFEQVWKLGSAQAQVPAVVAQVLGHEVDLLRALRLEHLRFTHQALERFGAVLPAHQRDGTEGARVVATLRDLEVTNVGRVPEELADARVARERVLDQPALGERDRKSTRLNSSHGYISYAVLCLKKKETQEQTC